MLPNAAPRPKTVSRGRRAPKKARPMLVAPASAAASRGSAHSVVVQCYCWCAQRGENQPSRLSDPSESSHSLFGSSTSCCTPSTKDCCGADGGILFFLFWRLLFSTIPAADAWRNQRRLAPLSSDFTLLTGSDSGDDRRCFLCRRRRRVFFCHAVTAAAADARAKETPPISKSG